MSTATGPAENNPFNALKGKPKEERVQIAKKLLKSIESELAEVMANALSPAEIANGSNLQDVVLGALLQEGRNSTSSPDQATERRVDADEKTVAMSNKDDICVVSETEVEKSVMIEALKVAMKQKVEESMSAQKPEQKAQSKGESKDQQNAKVEHDNTEIASILNTLKNQDAAAANKNSGSTAEAATARPLTHDELTAADALKQATMLTTASVWHGQPIFAPAAAPGVSKAASAAEAAKKGSSVPSGAVLTERDVIEIFLQRPKRRLDQNGLNTFSADSAAKPTLLAEQYNVASKTIRDIWNRNTWIRLTKPFWNAEELAAAGERPADAEGLIPAQTRKRGRPCGTKDAVPRTRSCRKRVPGKDGEPEDETGGDKEKPKKKPIKKRPTLSESGNFQAFVSALAQLGDREQAAGTVAGAKPLAADGGPAGNLKRHKVEDGAHAEIKTEGAQDAGARLRPLGQAGMSTSEAGAVSGALLEHSRLQELMAAAGGVSQLPAGALPFGFPIQYMAAGFPGAPIPPAAGLPNLPFIPVPVLPPELWATYAAPASAAFPAAALPHDAVAMHHAAAAAAAAAAASAPMGPMTQILQPKAIHPTPTVSAAHTNERVEVPMPLTLPD